MNNNISYNTWFNTWERLFNSKIIIKGKLDSWEKNCPKEPGFYLFTCPTIPLPEKYLKIGIGQGKEKGLRGRLKTHFEGKIKPKFGSILNDRLGRTISKNGITEYSRRDIYLGNYVLKKYNKDLTKINDRLWFLEEKCIVQIITCEELFKKYGTLKPVEKKIEEFLKSSLDVRLIKGYEPQPF
tara:strand:- start:818 stop:1366 length:549 start_codon:yes stop_codon:yes gene_type:complete